MSKAIMIKIGATIMHDSVKTCGCPMENSQIVRATCYKILKDYWYVVLTEEQRKVFDYSFEKYERECSLKAASNIHKEKKVVDNVSGV